MPSKPKQRGTERAVEVPIVASATHKFLATIESNGRDAADRVIGTNGIKWVVA